MSGWKFLGDAVAGVLAREYCLPTFRKGPRGQALKKPRRMVKRAFVEVAARPGLQLENTLRLDGGEEKTAGAARKPT